MLYRFCSIAKILKQLTIGFQRGLTVFHSFSEDLKKYDFDEILKPLNDDLNILETNGIQVPCIAFTILL